MNVGHVDKDRTWASGTKPRASGCTRNKAGHAPGWTEVFVHVHCAVHVQCCFTCTETIRTIRDGEARTATSSFTQLLSTATVVRSFVRSFCLMSSDAKSILGTIYKISLSWVYGNCLRRLPLSHSCTTGVQKQHQ